MLIKQTSVAFTLIYSSLLLHQLDRDTQNITLSECGNRFNQWNLLFSSNIMHKTRCLITLYCLYWLRCVYVKKSILTLKPQRISAAFIQVFSVFHVTNVSCVSSFQDRQSERHKDSRLNLRPPSQSATYATVSAWHHQPEKLILDSCGYEATVSHCFFIYNIDDRNAYCLP